MNNSNIRPYDLTELVEMYSGNMDNVKKTIDIFCDQMHKDIIMLKEKYESGDLLAVRAFAHRMKPNLKLLGIKEMHELVLSIEQNALNGNAAALSIELTRLYELTDITCDALHSELNV